MRTLLIGLPLLLLLCSCAGPRIIPPVRHYTAPSAVPVRQRISNAQIHAAKAQAALRTIPFPDDESRKSAQPALQITSGEIDALTLELVTAQTALAALEKECGTQTIDLNNCEIHKNEALRAAEAERDKTKAIVRQRNRVLLILAAALLWIFKTPIFGLFRIVTGGI